MHYFYIGAFILFIFVGMRSLGIRGFLLNALFLCLSVADHAEAVLRIDITRGNAEALSVVMSDVVAVDGTHDEQEMASVIAKVVRNNLESTGLFNVAENNKLNVNSRAVPGEGWRSKIGSAEVLITASVKMLPNQSKSNGDKQIEVRFRLWDAVTGKQMTGKMLTSHLSSIRRTSHIISDHVYHLLVGEKGYFDTRIVYIAEKDGVRRIAVMDQDGANNSFITDGHDLVLTPRFSPSAQKIIYMSYARGNARIFIRDIENGKEESLGNYKGVHSAPRFAPKGRKILMSRSLNGMTDIYEVNLVTRKRKKLTVRSSINTSASYSPDEQHIVFNSDRGGRPKIYVMDSDGSHQRRISFGDGTYTTPVWSPRGDWIGFTKVARGGFNIGVMRPDGSSERLIAQGYLVESPTWAPNGRVMIFAKETKMGSKKISRIHSVDVTGENERTIPTDPQYQVYDPSWSSLLSESVIFQ